ncbi:MAG: hypothetical protein VX583_12365 [Bdellovibrionota bacterium]|nr:hypothetical protein [Pseudobdellovibrionaceae bacterium]|tara:strand:+ start:189 stop:1148 length:960 start_codon:yes stop_codon:yes gene_type:complete
MNYKSLLIAMSIGVSSSLAHADNACESLLKKDFYQKNELKTSIENTEEGCVVSFELKTAREYRYAELKELSEIPHDDREKMGIFWDDVGFNIWLSNQEWEEGMAEWDRPLSPDSKYFSSLPEDIKADIEEGAYYKLRVKDLDTLKDTAKLQYSLNADGVLLGTKLSLQAIAELHAVGAEKNYTGGGYIKGSDAFLLSDHNERTFQIPMYLSYSVEYQFPVTFFAYSPGESYSKFIESFQFEDDLGDRVMSSVIGNYFSSSDVIAKYSSKILIPNTQGPEGSVVSPSRIGHDFKEQKEAAIFSGFIKAQEKKAPELNQQP